MASRAALSAPKRETETWPWHEVKWHSVPASILSSAERRMEAENFLAGGYGIRLAMEARSSSRACLGEMARVWQPSRLRGIQVGREHGTPFLAATQIFDLRPVPRKFLAIERTSNASERMASPSQILVTCSGTVGRATLATRAHEGMLISHDLLRVDPLREEQWGWVYAYLRSPQARAMMKAAQYGHIIKHLETQHLAGIPIPQISDRVAEKFNEQVKRIVQLRNSAVVNRTRAEERFLSCFPSFDPVPGSIAVNAIRASELFGGRRRLEANCYTRRVQQITAAFLTDAPSVCRAGDLASQIFVPGRFKHIYGDGGMPYLDSADILEVNPDITKYVLSLTPAEQEQYFVKPNWLLIPCSGQVYGNLGEVVLCSEAAVGRIYSNHLMRVVPRSGVRSGYLQLLLGHPALGRPKLVHMAFGSSVPEIAPADVAALVVPRLDKKVEDELADLMEESAKARDEADEVESKVAHEAENIVDRFMSGDVSDLFSSQI